MGTENTKRMSPAELREMCYAAAATAVVSYVLGYGYEDIAVHDDGEGWPTTASDVDTAMWPIGDDPGPTGDGEPSTDTAYSHIATIYEAAGLASRKLRGLGSHRISLIDDAMGRAMLDDPKIWGAIEALAAFLEGNYEGDGVYGALGSNTGDKYALMDGEDGGGLKVLKAAGLTPTYWEHEGLAAAHDRLSYMFAGNDAERKAALADLFSRPRPDGTAQAVDVS
jgi:hypothetical protein